ncbi:MFS general substrate transporter [Hymenopellis radicata]|nr:MFS general substrate transporter [Hymenopellis radicata]
MDRRLLPKTFMSNEMEDRTKYAQGSEEDCLLSVSTRHHDLDPYGRFSRKQKWVIVFLVSSCAFLTHFMARAFYPLVPHIAQELQSSGSLISMGISLPILFDGVGLMAGATYSTYYGRRPIYLIGLVVTCVGSFGVATSQSAVHLVVCRILQSFGASPAWTLGPAVVADLFRLEERGTAVGCFRLGFLSAAILAPICGGFATRYWSWRTLESAILAANMSVLALLYYLLPETSHSVINDSNKGRELCSQPGHRGFWRINPLQSLGLLKRPNLLLVTMASTFCSLSGYFLLTPLAYTIAPRYGISNPVYIGLLYVPSGIGNIIGAPVSGIISDLLIMKRMRNGDAYQPEDRLRGTLLAAGLLIPCSTLAFGLCTQLQAGKSGLLFNLLCLFINGFGDQVVLSPISTYNVDVMHSRSAESSAANIAIRAFFLSVITTGVLPLINAFGIVTANAIGAVLAWTGFLMLVLSIRYGERLRSYKKN